MSTKRKTSIPEPQSFSIPSSYDSDNRSHKIRKLHMLMPSAEEISKLNNSELVEIYNKIKSALQIAKTNCSHYTAELQNFYSMQQHYEAQALQLKSYIEWLKINQDREFNGIFDRLNKQLKNFDESVKIAKKGEISYQNHHLLLSPKPLNEYVARSDDNDNDNSKNSNNNNNNNVVNNDNIFGDSESSFFLPAVNVEEFDFNFDVDAINNLIASSSEIQPATTTIEAPTVQTDYSDLIDEEDTETEPLISTFVPPIVENSDKSKNPDRFVLKNRIIQYFPLLFPLRIQALTIGKEHLLELEILNQDKASGKLIFQVVFAGKYQDKVLFDNLETAWLVCSRLCTGDPNLQLPSTVNVYDEFRFVGGYVNIPYSLNFLLKNLYPRLQDNFRKGVIDKLPAMFDNRQKPLDSYQFENYPPRWLTILGLSASSSSSTVDPNHHN